jgi:hypothetical protein
MKTLLIGLLLVSTSALAATEPSSFESETVALPPTHPAMYSFVDVYHLTVAGPMAGSPALDSALETPIRVAAGATQLAAEPRFSISPGRQPDKWLLLIAGLALAGWVAHRRLAHTL